MMIDGINQLPAPLFGTWTRNVVDTIMSWLKKPRASTSQPLQWFAYIIIFLPS